MITFNLDLEIGVIKFQSLDWLVKILIISLIQCLQADIMLCIWTIFHSKVVDKIFL